MKKLITPVLVLVTHIVFCQQNKAPLTTEIIKTSSSVEKSFDKNVKLTLIIEKDASCIIKTKNAVTLESGFHVAEGGFFHIDSEDEITKKEIKNNLFTIYPNPSKSSISVSSTKDEIVKMVVISVDGKQVFETTTLPTKSYELDVSSFSNGIYILSVETNNTELITQKFIKE